MDFSDSKLDCETILALFIAREGKQIFTKIVRQKKHLVRKQKNSSIWPYLDILPKTFETKLINWPKKYDQFLMDDILTAQDQHEKGLIKLYDKIGKSVSWDEFLYGHNVVTSRGFRHWSNLSKFVN